MALAQYNTTLEYGNNILEFWNYDSTGNPESFEDTMGFNIERIDGDPINITTNTVSYASVEDEAGNPVDNAYILIQLDISKDSIKLTDSTLDYDDPTFEHIYSLKSSTKTYMYGKLNMIETAS